MCGIAGAIDASEDRAHARVSLINDLQAHRGPDHHIQIRVGAFTLGNTRLAIQDPGPAGNQPFVSADGRYYCVFNGEIYNHRQLVDRYQLSVRTTCDGEVIPALWAKLGPDSLAELRGMFAIALVDSLEEQLYLARDPFGIKPLYWRELPDGSLAFASEVRPLDRIAPGARVDVHAVASYLHLGAMAPDQSPFLEFCALPPNTVATLDRSRRLTTRPILPNGPLSSVAPATDLGAALTESVELHLGADVPTALLLSGGVDSAAIAGVGRRLGRDLHCLTVTTQGSTDEGGEAAQTARHYGHRFQRIPARLDGRDVTTFFAAMQRPTIDGLNTYLVAKAVREAGFKVALSGIGGDEVVGGYSHFRLLRYLPVLRALDRVPGPPVGSLARALAQLGVAGEAKSARLLSSGGPRDGRGLVLLQREVLPAPLVAGLTGLACQTTANVLALGSERSSSFSAMTAAEVATYLQPMLLPDADAFSMASAVELRVPFVDTGVFAASLGLPLRGGRRPGKAAIGRALQDPFLLERAARPKRGFSVPMQRWMAGPLAPALRAADEPDAPIWHVLDRAVARRAGLLPLRAGSRWAEAWAFAVLNAWLETTSARANSAR
jgi:asparagine synthase (glutamine-hydrolysing)